MTRLRVVVRGPFAVTDNGSRTWTSHGLPSHVPHHMRQCGRALRDVLPGMGRRAVFLPLLPTDSPHADAACGGDLGKVKVREIGENRRPAPAISARYFSVLGFASLCASRCDSSHIALITPNASATPIPNIQLKYHMFCSVRSVD